VANRSSKTRTLDPMHDFTFGGPIQMIALNIAGLFPGSDRGSHYLAFAMEYFTKYSEF